MNKIQYKFPPPYHQKKKIENSWNEKTTKLLMLLEEKQRLS